MKLRTPGLISCTIGSKAINIDYINACYLEKIDESSITIKKIYD